MSSFCSTWIFFHSVIFLSMCVPSSLMTSSSSLNRLNHHLLELNLGSNTPPLHEDKPRGLIKFYHKGAPYYEFTNFYPAKLLVNGEMYKTSEHYFQSMKFPNNPHIRKEIEAAATPSAAVAITRRPDVKKHVRKDWNVENANGICPVKEQVMLTALRAKFSQNLKLKTLLLRTGDAYLVEDAGAHDSYWGNGADGKGKNRLGELLMQVRDELRK